MIRANFHLTEQQAEQLRRESDKTGLSVAELIRRAVDAYLLKQARREKDEGNRRVRENAAPA